MVPFDGSELARAALAKARLYSIALSEAPPDLRDQILREGSLEVVAVSIVPESRHYARKKGWITESEDFNSRQVIEMLHREVTDLVPSAEFAFERVEGSATAGTVSNRLRKKAKELNAVTIFIGSENAGRIVQPLSSVGRGVSGDPRYDVYIIRRRLPPEKIRHLKSEFFVPD